MFSPERYTAAHQGATALDVQTRGRVRIEGADRRSYLQGLLTNDIEALSSGSGCYAALLTAQGRMISDMRVFELGDAVLLDLPLERAPRVATHLTDFVFSEDVTVHDVSSTLSHLVVLGATAAKALTLEPLRAFENRRVIVGGVEVTAAGNDDFGVPAIDLFVESAQKPAVLAALAQAGVASIDEEIAEVLRIEAGTPRFGVDMDENTIPLEAGIEDRAISATKGCYVGQEVIIRVLHRGHGRVARKLVGLVFAPDARVPIRGESLQAGNRQVGHVTSSAWSPVMGRPIALGYVHRDFASPDSVVQTGGENGQIAAVAPVPFIATATR